MPLGRGIDSFAGFGGETTYGVKGTIDTWAKIVSENIRHTKEMFVSESIDANWDQNIYYAHGKNEGSITFEQPYTGLELLWHAILGKYSYTADTPATGANTHLFEYVHDENVFPKGVSLEVVRGLGGTDDVCYLGMFPMKATIEFAPGQLLRTTFDMVGQGFERDTATAATLPSDNFIVPSHVTTLQVDGNAMTVLSGTIEIEVSRATDRAHYGDTLYKEPVIIGRPTGSVSLECEFSNETGADTNAWMEAFENETELGAAIISHTGGVLAGVTPATNEQFTITGTTLWVTEATPAVSGHDVTKVSVKGRITDGFNISMINKTTQVT